MTNNADIEIMQPGQRPRSPKVEGLKLGSLQSWCDTVPTGRRRLTMTAGVVLITVFGIGGTWAATAKLGGALVASGRVFAEGNNRVVQHLEGGIIENISIREGDHVAAGQTLMRLDETSNRSQLNRVQLEKAITTIELARWNAEQVEGARTFAVDPVSLEPFADDPRVKKALENQQAEFTSSRQAREQQLLVLDSTIASEKLSIEAYKDQEDSYRFQKEMQEKEEQAYTGLFEMGVIRQSQIFQLRRQVSSLDAQMKNAASNQEKGKSNIQSAEDKKRGIIYEHAQEVSKSITDAQKRLNQSEDYETRLKDMLRRANITSPVDGTILNLSFKSLGAVIKAGDQIAQVLPSSAPLMMEAFVAPKDITKVEIGQDVQIIFPNDQVNVVPPLHGKVAYISADTLQRREDEQSYYVVHMELAAEHHGRTILPGNVAEVYFQTEPKTLVQYLADPITRFALKAYTE
jgi:HlyD family type I secretion membrane fusion protein